MKFIAIIPSRYGSERLPAKPLLKLGGESMIERVYKRVASSVDPTYVATDHPKIAAEVERFGGRVVMTSTNHTNGTSRIAEALSKIEEVEGVEYRHILNIQGDQPFIEPIQIEELKLALSNPKAQIATLMKRIEKYDELINPSIPKVVVDLDGNALYFSRSTIPYVRDLPIEEWLNSNIYYKHIGVYGFTREALQKVTSLHTSTLENAEKLEQLRWLENGLKIAVRESFYETLSIDTPEDVNSLKTKGLI